MSVNLPTSSGNEEVLRVASTTTVHGKFGVAQQMHTHSGRFYGPDYAGLEFYGIVPLFGMNAKTGATAPLFPAALHSLVAATAAHIFVPDEPHRLSFHLGLIAWSGRTYAGGY